MGAQTLGIDVCSGRIVGQRVAGSLAAKRHRISWRHSRTELSDKLGAVHSDHLTLVGGVSPMQVLTDVGSRKGVVYSAWSEICGSTEAARCAGR